MPKKIDFPCPVCGSREFKVLYNDTLGEKTPSFDYSFGKECNLTYRIVVCKGCSHCYASPRPENLYANYDSEKEDPVYLGVQNQRIGTALKVIKIIRKYCPSGRLLDVGCATGDFLSVAKDYYRVEGLEIASWEARIARQRGFTVHNRLLGEMKEYFETYDVITLWSVIEHFEYPANEISSIYKLLKKDGIVCVWTGNINSIIPKFLGKKWWHFLGQHIQYFTPQSLRRLFEDRGFKTEYLGRFPYYADSRAIATTFRRYPFIPKMIIRSLEEGTLSKVKVTLTLPCEMFFIFRKV